MKYSLYAKPHKTPLELITKMKSQNLLVLDTAYAQLVLSEIKYFRFKIYLRPFLDVSKNFLNSMGIPEGWIV